MRNLLNKYLTGASMIALTFSLNISTANATCSPMPTCEELGYTETSCDTSAGYKCLKCPFDTTKIMKIDVCQGYPITGSYCWIDQSNSEYVVENCPNAEQYMRCKHTGCPKRIYASQGMYEYLELKDGKCVARRCTDMPDFFLAGTEPSGGFLTTNDPAEHCYDPVDGQRYIKPGCALGTYQYGKCVGGADSLAVGDLFELDNTRIGYIVDKGDNYIKFAALTDFNASFMGNCAGGGTSYCISMTEEEALADYNGYENTQAILQNNPEACNSDSCPYYKAVHYGAFSGDQYNALINSGALHWYVPSLGELMMAESFIYNSIGSYYSSTTMPIISSSGYYIVYPQNGSVNQYYGGRLIPFGRLDF